MTNPLIEIRALTLEIGGKYILRGIDLDVQNGEFLALIGCNGAGKTTLMKCLAGILRGWRGEIKIAGTTLRHCSRRQLARRISYVPQAEECAIPFTVLEFVLMARYPHLSPFTTLSKADYLLAEECLEKTELRAFRDQPMNTLSGGERRMVLIAAALAQGAEVMLLDEPTAFLDYRHQQQTLQLLARLNRETGLTIVAALHDVNAACRFGARVAALREGRLLSCVPPGKMLCADALAAVYGVAFTFARAADGRAVAVLEDHV